MRIETGYAVTLAFVVACTGPPPAEGELRAANSNNEEECGTFMCGNSPILGGFPFFRLDQSGTEPAPEGHLLITGFTGKYGAKLHMSVPPDGHVLRGVDDDAHLVEGQDLRHAHITVSSDVDGLAPTFDIEIIDVFKFLHYYEGGFDPDRPVESYEMLVRWTDSHGHPQSQLLCPYAVADPMIPDAARYSAVVYRGDVFDRASGSVVAVGAGAGNWLTIACAGDSLSKLLLIRHAQAAQAKGFTTSMAERTAALRMFRADYCGIALAQTEVGHPLDWANVGGWNGLDQRLNLDNVEAIWNEHGAVCLSHPRFVTKKQVPCAIDDCTQNDLDAWRERGAFISINPTVP